MEAAGVVATNQAVRFFAVRGDVSVIMAPFYESQWDNRCPTLRFLRKKFENLVLGVGTNARTTTKDTEITEEWKVSTCTRKDRSFNGFAMTSL